MSILGRAGRILDFLSPTFGAGDVTALAEGGFFASCFEPTLDFAPEPTLEDDAGALGATSPEAFFPFFPLRPPLHAIQREASPLRPRSPTALQLLRLHWSGMTA